MRFQSSWQIEAGAKSKPKIDPEEGVHTPPWDDMDTDVQSLLDDVCDAASTLIHDIAMGEDSRFHVQASGFVAEREDDFSNFVLSVNQQAQEAEPSEYPVRKTDEELAALTAGGTQEPQLEQEEPEQEEPKSEKPKATAGKKK